MQTYTTPCGKTFHCNSLDEARYVYREIYEEKTYLRNGIQLYHRDNVIDVGANIGIFTMFMMEQDLDLEVHAIEPSPDIFKILLTNVSSYGNRVHTHECGVSNKSGEDLFIHYPNYSIMSGFGASPDEDMKTLKKGILSNLKENGVNLAEVSEQVVNRMARVALGERKEIVCSIKTISEIIDHDNIESIGLLKIDAEGSEQAIMEGVREDHWKRIRQIVMEIHDKD
jgi:FkbM family methyltransferase